MIDPFAKQRSELFEFFKEGGHGKNAQPLEWRNDGQRLFDTLHMISDSHLDAMHKRMLEVKKEMETK